MGTQYIKRDNVRILGLAKNASQIFQGSLDEEIGKQWKEIAVINDKPKK
tara:strand:- start:520 stop:666 length:147 start_codon:yes stop_codon:yes gene_type:complete